MHPSAAIQRHPDRIARPRAGRAVASEPGVEARIQRLEAGLQPPVRVKGESATLTLSPKRMAELHVPGISVAVIRDAQNRVGPRIRRNEPRRRAGHARNAVPGGVDQQARVRAGRAAPRRPGKLDLDKDVNQYLKSWKLPENEFTRTTKVTLRGVLSHSAGLTVHGFPGYAAGEPLPSVPQILDGAKPANTPPIRVDAVPGTLYRYSGGGYVLAQQLLLDVTGVPTAKFLHDTVLAPLGMTHSTFEQPLPANRRSDVALPYSSNGAPVKAVHVYPEMAPAGLWTTPTDLAQYAIAVQQMLAGKSRTIISQRMARTMLTPVRGNVVGSGPIAVGPPAHRFFTHSGASRGLSMQPRRLRTWRRGSSS